MPVKSSFFVAFPAPFPSPGEALDALYGAFADWPRPTGLFCPECFGPQDEARILAPIPLRELPERDFCGIFAEHIDCSVGEEGFFHFFPRALETSFFNAGSFDDMTGVAIYCGLYSLDEARAAAVRGAAATAALGYFRHGDIAPFCQRGKSRPEWNRYFAGEAGVRLIRLLLALRVEPRAIFRTLLARDSEIVWDTVAAAFFEDRWLTLPWKSETGDTERINALVGRIAWIDLFDVVTKARLAAGLSHFDSSGPISRTSQKVEDEFAQRRAKALAEDRSSLERRLDEAFGKMKARPTHTGLQRGGRS